jgi:molybdopterin/thiamine biosynthesis adenylyltransferase
MVDLTNLQRQIIHHSAAVGIPKVESAKRTLADINPEVNVVALHERVDQDSLNQLIAEADVVLDASDNFSTRHALNRACFSNRKPLVSGAAVRFEGQVTVFDFRHRDSPCYHCLFPTDGEDEDMQCAVMGVFAPLTGIIGCTQAAEALKILIGFGETLNGRLLLLDGLTMRWRSVTLNKDPSCPLCGVKEVAQTS